MKYILAAALAVSGLIALVGPVSADNPRGVVVDHAWSRPTPPGAPTAVGYLTITNRGSRPDQLMSADSPATGTLSLHQMSMAGGIMRMRPVVGGLAIAPGATMNLDPNGDHLMFEGLKRPFKSGDQVPAVLHFQHAGAVRVSFVVR